MVNHGHVYQMNSKGFAIGADLHGVVRNFNNPENAIRSDARIEVVNLCQWGPRTGEPEVNSYLDESAVGLGRG